MNCFEVRQEDGGTLTVSGPSAICNDPGFFGKAKDTAFALRVQLCQLLLRLTLLAKDGHFDRAFELEIGHFRCVDWYF